MSKMEQGMSRRNFLVGAGAVSALGALGLAGCSPKKSASDKRPPRARPAVRRAARMIGWARLLKSLRAISRKRAKPIF